MLGVTGQSVGLWGTGHVSSDSDRKQYTKPLGVGDVVGCLMDLKEGVARFSVNGELLEEAYTIEASKDALYPHVMLRGGSRLRLNFGSELWGGAT